MKRTLLVCAFILSQVLSGQSEFGNLEKTLQNYIKGSSYNELDILKSAFAENATLYLTTRDGFKRFTPEEYAGFFKNRKKGEFNGRVGKVLSIDIIKDIAFAKVEIAGPDRKWVYIDLFLLKKVNENWQIISKTATKVNDSK
ncbi:nuclear transport factor 2 family protein [Tenacibaculum jejuense]|uniref:Intracellular protease/amidase, putative n=1 Tax=Tenacibaculum jejuense TaxID=584609 RepID=A0A238UD49_9FLAO